MSSTSFTNYVSTYLDKKLWDAMENYLADANSSFFSFPLNKIKNVGEIEILDTEVICVNAHNLPESFVGFDVYYEVQMMVFDNDRYHNPEEEYKKQWYLLKCEGDILDKFQSFIIKAIEPFYL